MIDFEPVLTGECLARSMTSLFSIKSGSIRKFTHWLANGSDFEPATLHDWPEIVNDLIKAARQHEPIPA